MKIPLLRTAALGAFTLLPLAGLHAQAPAAPAAVSPAAAKLDFGDFASSTITTKAWGALEAKNYDDAVAYTAKCIDTFKPQALAMQKALAAPTTDKDETFKQWALNDVGTCYYIQGQAYEKAGKQKDAVAAYKALADSLAFAQCYDTKGWFWKPADAAKDRLKALEFDSLK